MNGELIWVLSLLAVAIVLFATGRVRMDAVALFVIVAFALSGTLTVPEVFSGFSDPNVVLIAALFIIGDGLVRTGVATVMGTWLGKVAGEQGNQNVGFVDADRRGAWRVYEFNRRCRYLYSRGVKRCHAYANVAVAPDDAVKFCRADKRHDDAGGDAAEPGSQQ